MNEMENMEEAKNKFFQRIDELKQRREQDKRLEEDAAYWSQPLDIKDRD